MTNQGSDTQPPTLTSYDESTPPLVQTEQYDFDESLRTSQDKSTECTTPSEFAQSAMSTGHRKRQRAPPACTDGHVKGVRIFQLGMERIGCRTVHLTMRELQAVSSPRDQSDLEGPGLMWNETLSGLTITIRDDAIGRHCECPANVLIFEEDPRPYEQACNIFATRIAAGCSDHVHDSWPVLSLCSGRNLRRTSFSETVAQVCLRPATRWREGQGFCYSHFRARKKGELQDLEGERQPWVSYHEKLHRISGVTINLGDDIQMPQQLATDSRLSRGLLEWDKRMITSPILRIPKDTHCQSGPLCLEIAKIVMISVQDSWIRGQLPPSKPRCTTGAYCPTCARMTLQSQTSTIVPALTCAYTARLQPCMGLGIRPRTPDGMLTCENHQSARTLTRDFFNDLLGDGRACGEG